MKTEEPFKLPEKMIEETKDKLISVKKSTFDILEREAYRANIPLKKLISTVLDDYAQWVQTKRKK